jgi:GrpB-like predicted nucleotidyltransferase (UPF0157 family)
MDDIQLVDYDPRWPERYAAEAALVRSALRPDLVSSIEHIGSTAIPGLCAKPIIDILVVVRSLALAREVAVQPLVRLGYLFWEANPKPDHLFFVKGLPPRSSQRTHHVHLAEAGSSPLRAIIFRDFLRSHPLDALRYSTLKQDLALKFRNDREAYTDAKTAFVAEILSRAGAASA